MLSKNKSSLLPLHLPRHRHRLLSPPQPLLCKVTQVLPPLTPGQIQVSLTSLSRTIDDYDNMAKREIVAAKQEKAFSYVPLNSH
jgi:hypothetical protein